MTTPAAHAPRQTLKRTGLVGRVRGLVRKKTINDTFWIMGTEFAGMASQLITLVLISRAFERAEFGIFSGTVAFMHVISPFTTVGMGYVLVQRVVGERGDPDYEAGRAWTTVAVGGLIGVLFVVATGRIILPQVGIHVLVAIALGELVFTQITFTGKFCAQAMDRPAVGAQVIAVVWGLRLLAAIAYLVITPKPTLAGWSTFHMAASMVGAVLTIMALNRALLLNPKPGLAFKRDVKQGLGYSLTIGAVYLKNDADKTLLLTFHKTDAAALYSLAYRVIVPLFVPVRALADVTFARFFRQGDHSAEETYRLARRTTLIGGLFGLVGGTVIVLMAPLLPWLLGDKWEPAVLVTRWLAYVPFLVALQMYAFNALMGIRRQSLCLAVTVGTSLLNIALNLALIPRFDWRGSTAATLISEGTSVVAIWFLLRRETQMALPALEHLRSI